MDPSACGDSAAAASAPAVERAALFERDFGASLDDDLNISSAMAALFSFVTDINRFDPGPADALHLLRVFDRADHVTGVLQRGSAKAGLIPLAELEQEVTPLDAEGLRALLAEDTSPGQLQKLAKERHRARRQKDWKTADAIRDHLKKAGIQFIDAPEGVRYKLP